jgi:hypothetical protein
VELHVRYLQRGLAETFGEEAIYLEPRWVEHLAEDFADYLITATGGASVCATACRPNG